MAYEMIKLIHMSAALITISGLLLRGYWSISDSPQLTYRLTKILPHLIDTILFLTGLMLLIQMRYYPLYHAWMTLKLILVLVYILNGFYLLKWAKTRRSKIWGMIMAFLLFGAIVSLAYFKPTFIR